MLSSSAAAIAANSKASTKGKGKPETTTYVHLDFVNARNVRLWYVKHYMVLN